MIKELNEIESYLEFAYQINTDPFYKDPFYRTEAKLQEHLWKALQKENEHLWGIFEGQTIIGLFIFLIEEEEHYAEMITGLSKSEEAYEELIQYLKRKYLGYEIAFVFNPRNDILQKKLEFLDAKFDIEQQKMVLKDAKQIERKHQIMEINATYRDQYISIHNKEDIYWTAERVLNALDKFRVIIGVVDDQVVGYVDVSHCYEENEPYDIFVLSEYRNRGIATDMLSYAIEKNEDKGMMLMVDITNASAIHTYEKIGFVKVDGNNITAFWIA